MSASIGILLPRSGEYPAMSFDILDGIRLGLKNAGLNDVTLHAENIGYGENIENTQAVAERLVLQHDVQLIIAYSTSLNAEALYHFAQSMNKPFLFIDAGMEVFEAPKHALCRHLTLQGLLACGQLGSKAAQDGENVISAVSFFDGGYRSTWAFQEAITAKGGSIAGHYVSHYLPAEFSLEKLTEQFRTTDAKSVAAAFSSYFVGLFMEHLKNADDVLRSKPVYCSPFMADEQLLGTIPFPGATLHTIVPWATSLGNEVNNALLETVKKEKNKTANIFHLLGWEAAHTAKQILANGINSLDDWSFESPRGTVTFDAQTGNAFAPLYSGEIVADSNGNCTLEITGTIPVTAEEHRQQHFAKPVGEYSRWKNNFFCI